MSYVTVCCLCTVETWWKQNLKRKFHTWISSEEQNMRHRIWHPVHHDNPSSLRNSVHIWVLWIPLTPIDNAQDHLKPVPCGFVIDSAITVVGILGGQCRNSLHCITGVEAQGRCRCSNCTEFFGATYARQQHKSCFCSAWTAENRDKEHCTPSPAIEKQPGIKSCKFNAFMKYFSLLAKDNKMRSLLVHLLVWFPLWGIGNYHVRGKWYRLTLWSVFCCGPLDIVFLVTNAKYSLHSVCLKLHQMGVNTINYHPPWFKYECNLLFYCFWCF